VTIFGLLVRGGEIRVSKVDNLKAKTIREQVQENVKSGSSLMVLGAFSRGRFTAYIIG
jgi:hypothetical protein